MCDDNINKEKIREEIKALRQELHQLILKNFKRRKSFKVSDEIKSVSLQLDRLITAYMQDDETNPVEPQEKQHKKEQ